MLAKRRGANESSAVRCNRIRRLSTIEGGARPKHIVTAIVRQPEKLEKREGLIAKVGDVYNTTFLAALIRATMPSSAPSIPDGRIQTSMTIRFEEQLPSSPPSRMRGSNGSSG